MTKIFLDTEFTALEQNGQLISMGLVADSGESFYAEFTDFDEATLSDWHKVNVVTQLDFNKQVPFFRIQGNEYSVKGDTSIIKSKLQDFLKQFEFIEIWADVLAYDWVFFCELFGGALKLPDNVFYAPFDLSTFFRIKGLIEPKNKFEKDVSRFEFAGVRNTKQHNALLDAKVLLICWNKLMINE